jgi:acyl CoA:acetate/3-ketoacid CoA transferase beta subunit
VTDYSLDDLISACIARQIRDGEVMAQGLATPLVMAGYLLARHTHAPNMQFVSAIGQSVCAEPAPLALARVEELWLDKALVRLGFVRAAAEMLPRFAPKEFFRPGQVDRRGNFNNFAVGRDYRRPRLRLPGSGGIPDVTTYSHEVYLYVPRHSRAAFVAELDFVSGQGHVPGRALGSGPRYLVTDLGQFDFEGGAMRVTSVHPGVTLERIRARTGFELEIAPGCSETAPPTAEEVRLLREVIDPLGIRRLEMLGGAARKEAIREILEAEGAL